MPSVMPTLFGLPMPGRHLTPHMSQWLWLPFRANPVKRTTKAGTIANLLLPAVKGFAHDLSAPEPQAGRTVC